MNVKGSGTLSTASALKKKKQEERLAAVLKNGGITLPSVKDDDEKDANTTVDNILPSVKKSTISDSHIADRSGNRLNSSLGSSNPRTWLDTKNEREKSGYTLPRATAQNTSKVISEDESKTNDLNNKTSEWLMRNSYTADNGMRIINKPEEDSSAEETKKVDNNPKKQPEIVLESYPGYLAEKILQSTYNAVGSVLETISGTSKAAEKVLRSNLSQRYDEINATPDENGMLPVRKTSAQVRNQTGNRELFSNTLADETTNSGFDQAKEALAKNMSKYDEMHSGSTWKNRLTNVAYSFGNMLPSIIMSQISGVGLVSSAASIITTGLNTFSSAMGDALDDGANAQQAISYAAGSAFNEGVIDAALGGIAGWGTGLTSGAVKSLSGKISKTFASEVVGDIANFGLDKVVSEGLQESIQEVIDTGLKNEAYGAGEKIDWNNVLEAGIQGGMMGAIGGLSESAVNATANYQTNEENTKLLGNTIDTNINELNNKIATRAQENKTTLNDGITSINIGEDGTTTLPKVNTEANLQTQNSEQSESRVITADESAAKLESNPLKTVEQEDIIARAEKAVNETERSGILSGASEEKISSASRIAEKLGLQVQFFSETGSSGTIVNGYTENGTIFVNSQSGNSTASIIAHELTHKIEGTKEYKALGGFIKKQLGTDFNTLVADKSEKYAAAGVNLTSQNAASEVISEYVETKLLNDEASITSLVENNVSLAKRIYNRITETWKKLTGTPEQKTLTKARQLYRKALTASARAQTAGAVDTVRYSISSDEYDRGVKEDVKKLDAIIDGENAPIGEAPPKSEKEANDIVQAYKKKKASEKAKQKRISDNEAKKAAIQEKIANMSNEERSKYLRKIAQEKYQKQKAAEKKRAESKKEQEKIDNMSDEERLTYIKGKQAEEQDAKDRAEVEKFLNSAKGQRSDVKLTQSSINSAAKAVLQHTSSEYQKKGLSEQLAALYTYMSNGNESDGGVDWDSVREMANEIATDIADNIVFEEREVDERYKQIKQFLKGKKIGIPEVNTQDAAEALGFETWTQLRRSLFGKVFLSKNTVDNISIDAFYPELTEEYGDDLFPSEIIDVSSQLKQLASVLRESVTPLKNYLSDVSETEYNNARDAIAQDILAQFWNVKQEHTAEEANALKLAAERVKARTEMRDLREKLKTQKKVFESDTRKRAKASAERASRSDLAKSIKAQSAILQKMLLTPNKESHIPTAYVKAVGDFLSSLDFTTEKQNSETVSKLNEVRAIAADLADRAAKGSETIVIDPDLLNRIDGLKEVFKEKSLNQLNKEQLVELRKLTLSLKSSVLNENKTFADGERRRIGTLANAAVNDMLFQGEKNQPKEGSVARALDKFINYACIEPDAMFNRFGKTVYSLFNNLRMGQDAYIRTVKSTADYMNKVLKENKVDMSKWDGKDAEMINVSATEITGKEKTGTENEDKNALYMTPAQIINVYLLDKRNQGHKHMIEGGICLIDNKTGKRKRTVKISTLGLAAILDKMTPQMKAVADAMSKYLNGDIAELGNAVSRTLYGYDKFTEKNYFPIKVNEGSLNKMYGETVGEPKLENAGMTKSLNQFANNAAEIHSAFDIFNRHVTTMAAYNAYVPPLKDLSRVLNTKDETGDTVRAYVDTTYGDDAGKYIDDFTKRINSGQITDSFWNDDIGAKLIRSYKGAAVGLNMSVVMKQPISYIRAGTIIDGKYLIKALKGENKKTRTANLNEMLKNAPISLLKEWGFADMGFGKNLRQLYDDSTMTFSDKMSEISGKLPSEADKVTWARIWQAVKYEAEAKGKAGDMNYISERFRETIIKTQVVNTVFDTSPIMASDSGITRMATAFMAESLKTYNCMYEAIRSGNKKKIARTASALAANMAVEAVVSVLFSYLRSTDDEEDKTLGGVAKEFGLNMLQNLFVLPYIKDIANIITDAALGDGFGSSNMVYDGIESLADEIISLGNDLYSMANGNSAKKPVAKHIKSALSVIGKLTGVSVYNIWRDCESVVRRVADVTKSYDMQYVIDKTFYSPTNTANRKRYYNLLYAAQSDEASFNRIKKDLINNYGYSEDNINDGIKARYKKEENYIELADANENGIMTIFESNDVYNALPSASKKYADDVAEDYASSSALSELYNVEPNDNMQKIEDADALKGITASDYILYASYLKSIKKTDTATLVDKLNAVSSLSWLTDNEKARLYKFVTQSDGSTKQGDNVNAFLTGGMKFSDYSYCYKLYRSINDLDLRASEKQAQFEKQLAARGYTYDQRVIIEEALGFTTIIYANSEADRSSSGSSSRSSSRSGSRKSSRGGR